MSTFLVLHPRPEVASYIQEHHSYPSVWQGTFTDGRWFVLVCNSMGQLTIGIGDTLDRARVLSVQQPYWETTVDLGGDVALDSMWMRLHTSLVFDWNCSVDVTN